MNFCTLFWRMPIILGPVWAIGPLIRFSVLVLWYLAADWASLMTSWYRIPFCWGENRAKDDEGMMQRIKILLYILYHFYTKLWQPGTEGLSVLVWLWTASRVFELVTVESPHMPFFHSFLSLLPLFFCGLGNKPRSVFIFSPFRLCSGA